MHKHLVAVYRNIITILSLSLVIFMGGCGVTQILDIVKKVQSVTDTKRLLPSWPLDFTIDLADISMTFGDERIQKSLREGPMKGLLNYDAVGAGTITPPATAIPAIELGERLRVDTAVTTPIDPMSIGIPMTNRTIPATTIRFADTPAAALPFNFPLPIGSMTITQAKSKAKELSIDTSILKLPASASMATQVSSQQSLEEVRSATLSTGRLTVPLNNQTAGQLTVEIQLKDGTGQIVASGSREVTARSSGEIALVLDGKTVVSPLTIIASTSGSIPADTSLDSIDPENDKMQVGPSSLVMDASAAEVHLPRRQGKTPGTDYEASLAPKQQSFNISSRLPADSGVKRLDLVEVASGSLQISTNNGFGADGNLTIRLSGISQISGAASDGSLKVEINANSSATTSFDLAGALITPDASGNITAVVEPETLDTDNDRSHGLPASGSHNFVAVQRTDQLSGNVTLSPMTFRRVEGYFERQQDLPVSEVPIQLPTELASTGINPSQISVKFVIYNQSQINGEFKPDISGFLANGSTMSLDLYQPGVAPPKEVFKGTFNGSDTIEATASTAIEINERNSNILDLLKAGVTKLRMGGQASVTGNRITNRDQLAGQVEIAIPLALLVEPFGLGQARPPFDVKPPSPLNFDKSTQEQLRKYLRGIWLDIRVDNGWHLPLDLTILLSKLPDPYSDAAALTKKLSLGAGPTTTSQIALNQEESLLLPDLKTIGFRVTSPGTGGKAARLLLSDALRIRAMVRARAIMSGTLLDTGKK
ncbi:MAG: hypothetical protein HY692_05680 [Cyanobacteria bacterium NC_groundwater_1444_Ag_S-0.65um_54_12]|nr:hypothetical protein [Cyanobacteria bacterium NC_groundwater_1444_Ag_S-0.65um_54_12]